MPCTVTKVPVTLQKCPFVLQKCLKKDRNVPFPLALSLSLSLSINNVCEGWGRVDLRKHRVVQLAPYILSSEHTREIQSIRSMETIRLIARKRGVTQRPSLFQSLLHSQRHISSSTFSLSHFVRHGFSKPRRRKNGLGWCSFVVRIEQRPSRTSATACFRNNRSQQGKYISQFTSLVQNVCTSLF